MKRAMLIAAAFWTVSAGTAWPIDQIYTSTSESAYFGKIINISAAAISFESKRRRAREIPANEIKRIIFENSPDGLLAAQRAILGVEYEKAIDSLKKESPEVNRPEVANEIVSAALFHSPIGAFRSGRRERSRQAYVRVHQAQSQQLPLLCGLRTAGRHPRCEGRFRQCAEVLRDAGQAPWPDYKIGPRSPWGGPIWRKIMPPPPTRPLTTRSPTIPPATWPRPSGRRPASERPAAWSSPARPTWPCGALAKSSSGQTKDARSMPWPTTPRARP